jgi:CubicO group peptidase (beta-lactamase class C family)
MQVFQLERLKSIPDDDLFSNYPRKFACFAARTVVHALCIESVTGQLMRGIGMLRSTLPANARPVSKSSLLAMMLVSTLALAACGGGGGGGSGSNPPPPSPGGANTAPTVNAGADQAVTLPANAVDVAGTATDAENNTLTYAWSASPATGVAFATASAAASRVTFTDAGTYTLTLSVSDGTLTTTDTVQVVVNGVATPTNTAPTVQAGADATVTLPNGLDLAGSATDAENNTLTYAWTADPAAGVTFANAAAAATRATFTTAGTYTLTLTANDGTAAGSDALQVVVSAAALAWPGTDEETDPNHGWAEVAPLDVGMDVARLVEAATYAQSGGGSGMITRHGKLVHKWTDSGTPVINIDTRGDLLSTTKSMGGIALALAIDDGLVKLEDLAKTHLPTINTAPDPTALDTMTVLNLATHTAGFEKPAVNPLLSYGPPGTKWFYSDGGLNWLANLLTTRFNKDLNEVLAARVWGPLEITNDDLTWSSGTVVNNLRFRTLNSGIVANANAMARIGLLYLRKGKWKDQQIITESSVALAMTPRPEIAGADVVDDADFPLANTNYAVLWWTNATQQLPDVPADAFWGWGKGDSLLVVIPSLDIVAVRVGRNPNGQGLGMRNDWNGDYEVLKQFLTPIVQSVTDPSK